LGKFFLQNILTEKVFGDESQKLVFKEPPV